MFTQLENMRKICKRFIIIFLILVMVNSYIIPLGTNMVYAVEPSEGENSENEVEEQEIVFGNSKLKEYILEYYDFDGNDKITESDMLQIENLTFDFYQGDIDLTGLEYAKNLKKIEICSGKNISNPNNIEVFKNFKNLEELYLDLEDNGSGNQDISELLSNLNSLKILTIWYADLTNVDFSIFNQLDEICFGYVRLKNVQQISELNSLTKISIKNYNNGLTDFENFPVSNLQELVLSNVDVSKIDLSSNNNKIVSLSLQHCKVTDLSFLQNRTKIEHLNLSYNNIDDISPLASLTNLRELSLDDNNIENISSLSSLTNLRELSLNGNNIENISSLSSLTNLTKLLLVSNKIRNIASLENIVNLNSLLLMNNYITDISPIRDLENLRYANLSINPINPNYGDNLSTIQALENRGVSIMIDKFDESEIIEFNDKNLEKKIIEAGYDRDKNGKITVNEMEQINYLHCYDYQNPITDISELKYAINLTNLDLLINTKDISALSNLTKLNRLSLTSSEKKIDDVTALANLTNLQYLTLYSTDLKDISALENLTNLTTFDVQSTGGVEDISVISNFTNLEYLSIGGQSIRDISCLENLKNLKSISLGRNKINNISAIKDLENLESVSLDDNYIEDISPILEWKCLNKITDLSLRSNKIKDITLLPDIMTRLTNVTNFDLQYNCFEDISVITQLKKMSNFSSLKFSHLEYTIDLGKIERNSNQQINLPNTFSQVEEIFDELDWDIYGYDLDAGWDELNINIEGNIYNLDTTHIGKQEFTIQKNGISEDHTYPQNRISSISISISFVIEAQGDKNKNITFEDENLNRVILEKYDIDGDNRFTENDVINLTNIVIDEQNISSLNGIEQAVNLRTLYAPFNKIRDISPLMSLENLELASLHCNEITDITCLSNRRFKNIYAIGLVDNYIDFSNNSENTKTYLSEWQKDVEANGNVPYDYFKSGKELLCSFASSQKYGNPDDKNLVVNMDNKIKQAIIEQLNADTNGDGNLTREEMYNVLRYNSLSLDLSNLNLTNLSGLEYLNGGNLKIDISNNQISDITPLEHLFNLSELNASNNNIESIDGLPYYKTNYFRYYNFSNNKISDFSCVENWVGSYSTAGIGWRAGDGHSDRIVEFDFSNNNIEDISFVKNLKCISYLNLNNNKITDISSLKDYDFGANSGWYEEEYYSEEQLDYFRGISLRGNNIDSEEDGNKAAIEVFKNKGVKLFLDSDFERITIKDDTTNIEITTMGESTVRLLVDEIQEQSQEYQQMREQLEEMEIVYAVDISIVDGDYGEKIHITIPLPDEYNNKFVKILHKKANGEIEEFIRKVVDSNVSIDVDELSPFYIAYNENLLPKGDVNGDSKFNIKDWNMMYEYINETRELTEEEFNRADINGDRKVNGKDWNRLYEHINETNPLF